MEWFLYIIQFYFCTVVSSSVPFILYLSYGGKHLFVSLAGVLIHTPQPKSLEAGRG